MERQQTLPEPMVVASTATFHGDNSPREEPISAADMVADARAMLCDFKTTLPNAAQSAFTYAMPDETPESVHCKVETKSQEDRIREFAANAPREAIVETLLQFHELSKLLLKPLANPTTDSNKLMQEKDSTSALLASFAQSFHNNSNFSSFKTGTKPTLVDEDDTEWTRETSNLMSIASAIHEPAGTTTNVTKSVDELGFKTINQYLVVEQLGRGAQAKVKLVVDQETGEHRAMKIIRRPKCFGSSGGHGHQAAAARRAMIRLKQQIAILKKLRHPGIVHVYEVIDDPTADKLYLVLQMAQHGALVSMTDVGCETMPAQLFTHMARQICSGLAYLHAHGVVHRDIKPDNILRCFDDQVVLADFGVAEVFEYDEQVDFEWKQDHGMARRQVKIHGLSGTPAFLSPEILGGSDPTPPSKEGNDDCSEDDDAGGGNGEGIDGFAADVWALGMTFYVILVGKFPFNVCSERKLSLAGVRAALAEGFSVPSDLDLPDEWISLLKDMLNPDPAKRIDIYTARKRVKAMCNALEAKTIPSNENLDLLRDASDPFTPAQRDASPEPMGSRSTTPRSRRTSLLPIGSLYSKSPGDEHIVSAISSPSPPASKDGRRASATLPPPRRMHRRVSATHASENANVIQPDF